MSLLLLFQSAGAGISLTLDSAVATWTVPDITIGIGAGPEPPDVVVVTALDTVRGAYPGIGHRTNLQLVLATDVAQPFVILDRTGSAAVDITNFGFSFSIKRGLEDEDDEALVLITTYEVTGVYDPDPDINTQLVTISIADSVTEDLDPGQSHWELKRTNAGAASRLAYGRMHLIRGVHWG